MANPMETETFETMDGKRCRGQRVMGWDNFDGRYNKELDAICRGQWGVSFEYLRSLFIDRLSRIDHHWHLIKMSEI